MAVRYEVVTHNRAGRERAHEYLSEDELQPGVVLRLSGRDWLVERIEDGDPPRVRAKPARYRLTLRHPDGREEVGAFRRWRPDAPRFGHSFTTSDGRQPVNWEVVQEELAFDEQGEPYLELVAERDYEEAEQMPDHELEHTLARAGEELPSEAQDTIARAQETGLSVELVLLEPGTAPDWPESRRYVDVLTLDLVEDDLLELCGVDTENDARETWLGTVRERLGEDLEAFRRDVEDDHEEIEEWDFRDGRIFASVGSPDDEADPDKGHGWMCRLLDAGALTVAGFHRLRKPEIVI